MSIGLGLEDIDGITQVIDPSGQERWVTAKQKDYPVACRCCGAPTQSHTYRPMSRLVDVPQGRMRTYIHLSRRRRRCSAQTCQQLVPVHRPASLDPKFNCTARLSEFVEAQCLDIQRQFSLIASDVGISERTLRDMFDRLFKRMEGRVLRVATPGTLRLHPAVLGNKKCFLIENVTHNTLVDILEDRSPRRLSEWLKASAYFETPRRLLIPPDKEIRQAVRDALPVTCRLVVAPDQVRAVLVPRLVAAGESLSVAQGLVDELFEMYGASFRGSKREWLQAIQTISALHPDRQWLWSWLKEWEEALLAGGPQDLLPPRDVTRVVELLNLLGNGYSFGRLRQRLLLNSHLVKAYFRRATEEGTWSRATTFTVTAGSEGRYEYALAGRGRPRARVGVPLEWLIWQLTEAVDSTPHQFARRG